MHFVITGGGTGGHIYPALAIARGIQEKYPGAEILYIGSERGLEATIVPKAGLEFVPLRVSGLRRRVTPGNLLSLWRAGRGLVKARKIIKHFAPRVVVGTGGYVCGPVIIAAASLRVPTLIHEQNALPGITNRVLSRFAGRVTTTFEDSLARFPRRANVRLTGLPVRPEILVADRDAARETFDVQPDQKMVLSFGGSQGARSINRAMLGVLKEFRENKQVKFLHVTGQGQYREFLDRCRQEKITPADNIRIIAYMHEMPGALASSDLVICRAGAATLSEITVRGIPSVLIPYPYAAENHQEYNARALVEKGAAEMVLDKEVSGPVLARKLRSILDDAQCLQRMAAASLAAGRPGALDDILESMDDLLQA